jgi:hypothetical protein
VKLPHNSSQNSHNPPTNQPTNQTSHTSSESRNPNGRQLTSHPVQRNVKKNRKTFKTHIISFVIASKGAEQKGEMEREFIVKICGKT